MIIVNNLDSRVGRGGCMAIGRSDRSRDPDVAVIGMKIFRFETKSQTSHGTPEQTFTLYLQQQIWIETETLSGSISHTVM